MCLENNIATPATEVHHKVSIDDAPWLRLERSNLMCLCNACHKAIHANLAEPALPGVGKKWQKRA